jgi:hypothetical protein
MKGRAPSPANRTKIPLNFSAQQTCRLKLEKECDFRAKRFRHEKPWNESIQFQ